MRSDGRRLAGSRTISRRVFTVGPVSVITLEIVEPNLRVFIHRRSGVRSDSRLYPSELPDRFVNWPALGLGLAGAGCAWTDDGQLETRVDRLTFWPRLLGYGGLNDGFADDAFIVVQSPSWAMPQRPTSTPGSGLIAALRSEAEDLLAARLTWSSVAPRWRALLQAEGLSLPDQQLAPSPNQPLVEALDSALARPHCSPGVIDVTEALRVSRATAARLIGAAEARGDLPFGWREAKRRARLKLATMLLSRVDADLEQVARRVGFSNSSSMARAFRAAGMLSPASVAARLRRGRDT